MKLLLRTVCLGLTLLGTSACAQEGAPKPLVKETIHPLRVVRREDGVFFVDFGRDAFGQLKLDLNLATAANLTVRLGEKLSDASHIDPKPGGSIRYQEEDVAVDAGQPVIVHLPRQDARRMPADVGRVMPFRYAELVNVPAGVTAESLASHGVEQVAVHYPFDDKAAEFESSDEKLNAIWALCKYSIKASSYARVFVDGDRERKPYEADAFINGLGWYCCTDDLTLPAYTDQYLIHHPTWPTEWIMFSVLCSWNDYLYSGDTAALRQAYPDLKAKTLRALERPDGLISTAKAPALVTDAIHLNDKLRDIVDWPATERDGCEMKPINTVVNAFHYRSLALMSRMAQAIGNDAEAADFTTAAERTKSAINRVLLDPIHGTYVDGEGSAHSSLHANVFPLAFGVVPEDQREKVLGFLQSRGMACSVYGAQFLLEGLFDNGHGDDAIALMEAPGNRSWRHMVEDVATTITLEAWDQSFKPNQDWNHAWGAAPANLIPRKVLGIEPLAPGFAKVLIWPRAAGKSGPLRWARGHVPTVRGPIGVDWKSSADRFEMTIDLPANTPAQVRLPGDWGKHVSVDGKAVKGNEVGGAILVELGGQAGQVFSLVVGGSSWKKSG
jgi:hypothetical protein